MLRGTLVTVGLVGVLGLVGCTPDVRVEDSGAGIRVSARSIADSDGYCGIGVKVENLGAGPARFETDDAQVFGGSAWTEWNLPFEDVEDGGEYHGYVVGDFPTSLEPGEAATDAFVVNCDDEPFVLTVNSVDRGSVRFAF